MIMIIFEVDPSTVKKNPNYGKNMYAEGLIEGVFTFNGNVTIFGELVGNEVTAFTKEGLVLTGIVTSAERNMYSDIATYTAMLTKQPSDIVTDSTIINVGLAESVTISRQIFDMGVDDVEYFYKYLPTTCPNCGVTHSYSDWGRDYSDSGYSFATCPSCGVEDDYSHGGIDMTTETIGTKPPEDGENLRKNGYRGPEKCCENCAWCYHDYDEVRECEHPANHNAKRYGKKYDPLNEDTHCSVSVYPEDVCDLWSDTRNK